MPEDYEALYRQELARRLSQLEQIVREAMSKFDEHNSDLAREIKALEVRLGIAETSLKLKAGVWGAMSGLATGLGFVILLLLSRIIH